MGVVLTDTHMRLKLQSDIFCQSSRKWTANKKNFFSKKKQGKGIEDNLNYIITINNNKSLCLSVCL